LFTHHAVKSVAAALDLYSLEVRTQVAFVQQAMVHGIGEDAASSMLT
jgi:hypothetical protein